MFPSTAGSASIYNDFTTPPYSLEASRNMSSNNSNFVNQHSPLYYFYNDNDDDDADSDTFGSRIVTNNNNISGSHNVSNGSYSYLDGIEDVDGSGVTDSFYDYEFDGSLPVDELVPVSMIYGVTLVVGVVGNLLVIAAVARDRRLRSITNIFLTSLAVADLALLCFCVPVKCVAFFSFTWAFGFFLCKSVHYFQIVAMICSVMTLTVMSIERNIAILSPLRSKRICTRGRARLVVVLLWLGSFILALPILVGIHHKEVGERRKGYWCLKEWTKPAYGILFESYMLILLFMLPVGVMIVSYTTICLELSKGTRFRRQATCTQSTGSNRGLSNNKGRYSNANLTAQSGAAANAMLNNRHRERMDKEKMKVIRMLIVVVVLFAVCWGPILINNLLVSLGMLNKLHLGHLKPLRQAIFILSYLNSTLNPLVYGFMSRHFRRGFREAICACCVTKSRHGGEGRLTRGMRGGTTTNRQSCYNASDYRTSVVRTGTIRLSPVPEPFLAQDPLEGEEMEEHPITSVRYGRKVWARKERLSQRMSDIKNLEDDGLS